MFSGIDNLDIGLQIQRLGLRYIDFFESNIFDDILLSVKIADRPIDAERQLIRLEFAEGDFLQTFQIANRIQVTRGSEDRIGSVIDTDAYIEGSLGSKLKDIMPLVDRGHELSKARFFSILTPQFLQSLNPTY